MKKIYLIGCSVALTASGATTQDISESGIKADNLYVCGNVEKDGEINNWLGPSVVNETIYNEYFRLDKVEEGVFEGVYYILEKDNLDDNSIFPDALPQFRFFSKLEGWISDYSLGSNTDDFYCEPVDLENGAVETPIIEKGLGNWGVCLGTTWTSSYVNMRVDLNNAVLRLQRVDSGVEEISTSNISLEKWFNLQGCPVEKPENGLFIHTVDGKSRVELVK